MKFKQYCEIMYAIENYLKGLMGPAISEGSFKPTKIVHHHIYLAIEKSKIIALLL